MQASLRRLSGDRAWAEGGVTGAAGFGWTREGLKCGFLSEPHFTFPLSD